MTQRSATTWLFVDAVPDFGGHEVMLLRWLQALQAPGMPIRPALLARAEGRLQQQAPAGLACPPLPARAPLWRELVALVRQVRALRPECVVVASGALGAHVPHV
ncbi:MAG TPA: hypothetical protein VMS38_07015, partial [Pseudorhodoferax sp.]|nr:hypothetical protein [Pseudorhodoferax sp.]